MSVCVVSVVCNQVEVSASGRSIAKKSPTDFDVSEYDLEISTMRPCPTGDVEPRTSKLLPIKLLLMKETEMTAETLLFCSAVMLFVHTFSKQ